MLDSAMPGEDREQPRDRAGEPYELIPRSTALLRELTD